MQLILDRNHSVEDECALETLLDGLFLVEVELLVVLNPLNLWKEDLFVVLLSENPMAKHQRPESLRGVLIHLSLDLWRRRVELHHTIRSFDIEDIVSLRRTIAEHTHAFAM